MSGTGFWKEWKTKLKRDFRRLSGLSFPKATGERGCILCPRGKLPPAHCHAGSPGSQFALLRGGDGRLEGNGGVRLFPCTGCKCFSFGHPTLLPPLLARWLALSSHYACHFRFFLSKRRTACFPDRKRRRDQSYGSSTLSFLSTRCKLFPVFLHR